MLPCTLINVLVCLSTRADQTRPYGTEIREGFQMTSIKTQLVLAQTKIATGGLQSWLQENIVPLLLLAVAVLMLWIGGGKGDNAGVMRRIGGVVIALAIVGFAVTGAGIDVGKWLAGLFTS